MATVSISGHLKTAASVPINNAAVTFRLINLGGNLPTIAGTNIIIPTAVTMTTDVNGLFSGSIQGNDTITPNGTVYEVIFSGSIVATYNLAGAGPINLDTYPPITTYPVPSSGVPTNILTGNNLFVGNNTFSGATTLAVINISGIFTLNPGPLTLISNAASPRTVTFPDNTGTVAELDFAQTWTATQTLAGLDATSIGATTPGTGAFTTLSATGKVTKYNNISTVSGGIPSEYATIDLTAQGAAIGATTLYAVPASGAGMYRISWMAKVTQASDISSVLGGATGFQIVYTDADDSVSVTTSIRNDYLNFIDNRYNVSKPTSYNNTTGTQMSGVIVVNAKASTNIQYQFGYTDSHTSTAMQFSLHAKLEAL